MSSEHKSHLKCGFGEAFEGSLSEESEEVGNQLSTRLRSFFCWGMAQGYSLMSLNHNREIFYGI